MIKAEFDMPKLIGSLKKTSKAFGDTNKTAIARWGVQTCRELAVSTQVFGKGKARKKQVDAINAGIHGTIAEVGAKEFQRLSSGKQQQAKIRGRWVRVTPDRLLATADDANQWIEGHRGEKGHAEQMPQDRIGIAPKPVVMAVRKLRRERAGIAKGAWLGAGAAIARRQRGANRITIGKNFLGYAQKHARRGDARATLDPFNPIAFLQNKSAHSGSSYVLSESEKRKAVGFGLRKTIAWYRRAAKQALDQ